MTRFIGCIDLHNGEVKQIVGSTLDKVGQALPSTNFVSEYPPSHYSKLYKKHNIKGSHVIKLGPGNDAAAVDALKASPGFLQLGGGVTIENCQYWLKYASKVIVTSAMFNQEGSFQLERLKDLANICGKDRLVIDLSCRKAPTAERGHRWIVAMNKWQTLTDLELNLQTLKELSNYTNEFLIHAVDVEGLCEGIDVELVAHLGTWLSSLGADIKLVYAGGSRSVKDLEVVERLSNGRIDLTYGSSLDIFGGKYVKFDDCCRWNDSHQDINNT